MLEFDRLRFVQLRLILRPQRALFYEQFEVMTVGFEAVFAYYVDGYRDIIDIIMYVWCWNL